VGAQGLQFRRKGQVAAELSVIQRLYAQTVADQAQGPLFTIPQGNGEHADKAFHRGLQAPFDNGR